MLTTSCQKGNTQVVLQKISFSSEKLNQAVGDQVHLTPLFTPSVFSSIDVTWTTTDDAVVSIMPGQATVVCKKPGTAWITVKDKNSATSGKCEIVVN